MESIKMKDHLKSNECLVQILNEKNIILTNELEILRLKLVNYINENDNLKINLN